jgi:hypothetical protein
LILHGEQNLFRSIQSCWYSLARSFDKEKKFMKAGRLLAARLAALGIACAARGRMHETIGGEEPALWKVQKLIASKKYVDLMHEFARGIPRWSRFPDERERFLTGNEKRPDSGIGVGRLVPGRSDLALPGELTKSRRRIEGRR